MKIVRIIARLNVGGPARHVAWLNEAFERAGHRSLLVAGTVPPGEDDMSYFAESLGVRTERIEEMSREISPKDAVTVWKLYRLLLRERPDVVHTHTAKAGTVGRLAAFAYRWLTPATFAGRPRRLRVVHTYHGHIFHSYYGPLKTRLFLSIEKFLARITDRIVVISPQQLEEIHSRFGVGRASQFAVVPLGLDLRAFDDWDARRHVMREELGARDEDVLVGIVGRLTEVKNHELFLEAVARYRASKASENAALGRRVRFLVIGDGSLRPLLEARACDPALSDSVEFLGTRNDPENFYPALDIVALTSRNEGTPLTLIEAMANSRAVIATGVGGVVDLVGGLDEGALRRPHAWQICERGVMVRPDDAEAFAEGLSHLIENGALRESMGERGRAFVESFYSKERLVEDLTHLYEGLLNPVRAATSSDAERQPSNASGDISRAGRRI